MHILDFGSGWEGQVLDLWREDYGIAALKRYVQDEVGNITVHAFDPLAIDKEGPKKRNGIQFHLHNSFQGIPRGLDIICALHPFPGVITQTKIHLKADIEYNRYISQLAEVIGYKTRDRANIVLQFDRALDKQCRNTGGQIFIDKLNNYGTHYDYRLSPLKPLNPEPRLPSISYKFSSFHLFEKRDIT